MKLHMRPCHQVEIITPKKVRLNGFWYGSYAPKQVIVLVHGLSSSLFGKADLVKLLATNGTAVLVFNNRGHDKISTSSTVGGRRIRAGAAHEVFEDSVDDIDGAVKFAKQFMAPVFLAGSSTGCQKIVYWSSKRKGGVNGLMLMAPISDYASTRKLYGNALMKRAEKIARTFIRNKQPHELLPLHSEDWSFIIDAQRYMSLYTGTSNEEVFTYWAPERVPRAFKSVKVPMHVFLAERDEYADKPAHTIAAWFEQHLYAGEVTIIPKVQHSFKGAEKEVAKLMTRFMKETLG